MKVILINPPIDMAQILGDGSVFSPPAAPMSLMYIASYVRKHNLEASIEIIDAYLRKYSIDQLVNILRSKKPDIVGITTVTANGHSTFKLGREIKKKIPNAFIVLGNIHASVFRDTYLSNSACDAVINGEGEIPMLELTLALSRKSPDLSKVPGISFIDQHGTIQNVPPVFADLSTMPFPAWDLIEYESYGGINRTNTISFSRGCVFRCHFCVVHQKKYRVRPAEHVVEELELLLKRTGVKRFSFGDPLFLGNRHSAANLCELIIKKEMHRRITWWCEAHVNLIDNDILKLMKASGCNHITFGIESGNDSVLKACNKKSNTDQISKAVTLAHKLGFKASGCFILGLPGDTEKTINETISFANKLPLYSAQFSTFCPYPGSYFFEILKNQGYFDVDFTDLNQLLHFWDKFSAYTAFTSHLDPIFTPDGISPGRLKQLQKKAFIKFYSKPQHFFSQLYRINRSTWIDIFKSARRLCS